MKYNNLLFVVFFWSILTTIAYSQNSDDKPVRKTVFILVDGISDDVIQEVETPNLDKIVKAGAFLPAYVGGGAGTYSQSPTVSAVGYNHLLTGTWANKHNVWDNDIKNPNYRYWTIFRHLKYQYPSKRIAVFSSWSDNRSKLIGTGLEATGGLQMDYSFDGFDLDTLSFPHEGEYIRDIDNFVADETARYIAEESPDLSWVYLWFTDDMGHAYGDHPKFHQAIQTMDDQVGRIWAAVKEREKNHNEEWLVVITTDHGRTADTGKGHGGQSDRERNTWIVTNNSNINEYGRSHRVAITDILPSIADFMDISIPKYREMEVDGVTFLGEADAIQLSGEKSGDALMLSWSAIAKSGTARAWLTTTNKFSVGGEDFYYYLGEVNIADEQAEFDVSEIPSRFYKVVLELPHHYLNTWIEE